MEKELEKRIEEDVRIKMELEADMSLAIADVLKKYGIEGKYIFNVSSIQGRQLVLPLWCIASGYSTVEEPKKVGPI